MEHDYFDVCHRRNSKVRWISRVLKVSGFVDFENLRLLINKKIARIEKRSGPLGEDVVSRITENYLLAKIAMRYIERKIKPYSPKIRKNSPTHHFRQKTLASPNFSFEKSCCPIYKEKHFRLGNAPSILFPGFLPEGNEAYFLLRKSFLKHGSLYYFNYPTIYFNKLTIFHQIYDTIAEVNNRKLKNAGQKSAPFLIATSFGCHMIVSFLRWLNENGLTDSLDIRGIILISPVLCLDDLVDPALTRQKTLVGRAVSHLSTADEENPEEIRKAMGKAKSIFLKMFTSGRDLMKFESRELIPIFAIEDNVLGVFEKAEEEDDGYFNRFMELKQEPPIQSQFLSATPTLVLFAEQEADVLTPNSTTLSALSNVETLHRIFPNGSVEFVYSNNKRKVTHSDLIFQASRFADHLEPWMSRLAMGQAVS